jgi:hypothetical protein
VARDASKEFLTELKKFIQELPSTLDDMESLLTNNRIWMDRTQGVGAISQDLAVKYGLSGPNLRATGVNWDLRKNMPYLCYNDFDFNVITGKNGDAYDRYLVRCQEMRESIKILEQAIAGLPEGPINADVPEVVIPTKEQVYTQMEALIWHFKIISEGFAPPVGQIYSAIENPKGEEVATKQQVKAEVEKEKDEFRQLILPHILDGLLPPAIGKKLYGDGEESKEERRSLVARIWQFLATDKKLGDAIHAHAKGVLTAGLVSASHGLVNRAASGRPDGIKLLYEATGFHNPKVQHEHSGDIKVTLNIPRPGEDADTQEPIDAHVVDDELALDE